MSELKVEKIENLIRSIIPTLTMYRVNYGFQRGYASVEPFGLYSGLTGALSVATFKGNMDAKRLETWRDSMVKHLRGQDEQEAYLNAMADFGSISHEVLVRIKENGKLDWGYEQDYAANCFEQSARSNGIIPNATIIGKQVNEYCKGAASLLQFVHENVVEILAIESMAKSDELQIATPIDIVAKIKQKGGDVLASINMKTSKQFSDHQFEQAAVEKYLWNETYPDYQVQKTGLYRAKDWMLSKNIPTYDFKLLSEQDEYEMLSDAKQRLLLCKKSPKSTYMTFPNSILTFLGETKLGESPKIGYRSIEEVFKRSIGMEVLAVA